MRKPKAGLWSKIPSREEFEIIDIFMRKPFDELGISEIMKETGKKSKPWVFNVLNGFEDRGFIKKERKGNMNLYSANLDSPALIGHFLFIQNLKMEGSGQLDKISKLILNIPLKNYCLIIFGSWASQNQRAGSDLDICFLIESSGVKKKIKPYLNESKLKTRQGIDEHYITYNEFIEMLLRPEENLGKQIYKNHILVFNGAVFYELVKEAHKRGFGG